MTRLRQWIQANKRTHPHKPPQTHAPQPVPETKAASAPGESISLETLFGAPTQSQVPGLIALPPSAQKQMAASRPQTPSSEQKKSAKASKAQSKTPKDVAKPPSDKDSSKLLLNLLHGSKPVPAPQAETDQSRVDGSTALRNLLGLESNPVSHTLQPSMPQARTTPQEHQAQLYSILGRPKQAPAQGHPHTGWPGVGLHQAQGQWSTMQSSTAHDQNVPVAENAPAPPSKDEHRNRLLSLLGGALPGAPPSRPPEAHGSIEAASLPPIQTPPVIHPQAHAVHGPSSQPGSAHLFQAHYGVQRPHMPPLPEHLPHHPTPPGPLPPHQPPRPSHLGHPPPPGQSMWPNDPSHPAATNSTTTQAPPSTHHHALFSTLLGSPTRAKPSHPAPWPPQPAMPQPGSSTPRAGHASTPTSAPAAPGGPSPGANSANLLDILNRPRQSPASGSANPSAPPGQATANPLLATLLGK